MLQLCLIIVITIHHTYASTLPFMVCVHVCASVERRALAQKILSNASIMTMLFPLITWRGGEGRGGGGDERGGVEAEPHEYA